MGHRGGACEAIRNATEVKGWIKRHNRDRLDIVRAQRFEEARDAETGLGLSRTEAAAYAAESLRGTRAATTPAAVLKLISRMKRNHAKAFGRYYVGADSLHWEAHHFRERLPSEDNALIWKWRHRAASRGNARMREAEEADLRHVRQRVLVVRKEHAKH